MRTRRLFTFPVYAMFIHTTQVLQAVVCVVLALIFDINQVDHQKAAEIINNISLAIVIVIVAINVIINVFDQNGIAQLLIEKTWTRVILLNGSVGPRGGEWTSGSIHYLWRTGWKQRTIDSRSIFGQRFFLLSLLLLCPWCLLASVLFNIISVLEHE